MLTTGDHIRLNRQEHKLLTSLAGSDSSGIKTRRQLEHFVRAHLVNYPGRSPEERLLRRLLESFLPPS